MRHIGTIAVDSKPELLPLGLDEPAHYAAWRFRGLLQERGVRVTGDVAAMHRPMTAPDVPALRDNAPRPAPASGEFLDRLTPRPLAENLG